MQKLFSFDYEFKEYHVETCHCRNFFRFVQSKEILQQYNTESENRVEKEIRRGTL